MNNNTYQISPTKDISQLISSLFNSAGENIEPLNIPNNILAGKEISTLITNFKDSKDWDEQLSVVQRAISFVKGNACDYLDFISRLPELISQIISCIQNARTTLVKYSCLLISLLAKALNERFDSLTDIVILPLFQTSSSGTQIISSSCKYAIFSIVHNVTSRKVLSFILNQAASKSQIEKSIASESIKFIVTEWHRNALFPYLKQLEKTIFELLSDSNFDTKDNAKQAAMQLMKLFPDRNSVLYSICNNNNSNSNNDLSNKKASAYSKDYSNTISFSYNITKVQPNSKPQKETNTKTKNELNLKQSINTSDSNDKKFVSNIPRKNRNIYSSSNYKLPEPNTSDEAHTMTFEPDLISSQSSISEIQKQVDEAKTISFSFDLASKGPSSFYSKERSKQNSNLSVHFNRPNSGTKTSQNSSAITNTENTTKTNQMNSFFSSSESDEIKVKNPNNSSFSNTENITKMPNLTISKIENKTNQNQNNSFEQNKEENNNSGTRIEVSPLNYFSTSLISFQLNNFECNKEKESQEKFLDSIRTTIATKQTVFIEDNAESISSGFLLCLQSPNENIQISALNLFVDVIKIIPNSFNENLELFVKIMIEKADKSNTKTSMNATTALRAISTQFPAEKLILIAVQCPESDSLLSFLANLVRNDEEILNNDQISSALLPICCKVYETTKEQRFSALSVGLLNKISEKNPKIFKIFANSVDEQWFKLLKSLYLDPNDNFELSSNNKEKESKNVPTRILSSMVKYTKKNNTPESRLDDLLRQLNVEKIKFTILNNLINFFKETNAEVFESAISPLINLIHSSYHEQVKECIKIIATTEGGVAFSSFLDSVVDHFIADTSLKSIDFLNNVVKYYKSRDLSPRVQQILEKIKPYLEDSYAPARKAAVFLIVELRLAIGKAFEGEINKLPNVSKKMVYFYISKRQTI